MANPEYTQEIFENALKEILEQAKEDGKTTLRVTANDIHNKVGVKGGRYPSICSAMRRLSGIETLDIKDINQETVTIKTPCGQCTDTVISGNSSSVEYEYNIQRTLDKHTST